MYTTRSSPECVLETHCERVDEVLPMSYSNHVLGLPDGMYRTVFQQVYRIKMRNMCSSLLKTNLINCLGQIFAESIGKRFRLLM